MSENNPKPDAKQALNMVENAAGSVPQAEVIQQQQPKYKPAQNLLEQLEYFKLSYKLRFSHILWMGLATYICYDRFKAYQLYREEKQHIFSKSRKALQEKYGKLNQKYTQSTIHPRGDPDQGDWIYFQELSDSDQKVFLERKIGFQDKSSNFNTFMPLYITSGICFPFTSVLIGLIFRNKVFNEQLQSQDKQPDSKEQQALLPQEINPPSPPPQENQLNIQHSPDNIAQENNKLSNDTKEEKKKGNRFDFINNLISYPTFNMIYGSITGFSIVSAMKILRSFI